MEKLPTIKDLLAHTEKMFAAGWRLKGGRMVPPPGTPEVIICDYIGIIKPTPMGGKMRTKVAVLIEESRKERHEI